MSRWRVSAHNWAIMGWVYNLMGKGKWSTHFHLRLEICRLLIAVVHLGCCGCCSCVESGDDNEEEDDGFEGTPRPMLPYSSMYIFGPTNPWVRVSFLETVDLGRSGWLVLGAFCVVNLFLMSLITTVKLTEDGISTTIKDFAVTWEHVLPWENRCGEVRMWDNRRHQQCWTALAECSLSECFVV